MTKMPRKTVCRLLILAAVVILALFVPLPMGQMKDGGTKVYRAVTYRVVKWNRLYSETATAEDGTESVTFEGQYRKTVVYWFSDAARSDAELWQAEQESPDFRDYLVED